MNRSVTDINPVFGICQQRNNELDIFLDRINFILNGRKITPWAKSLGLSNGDVTRIKAGRVPGPEKLVPICRAENVSLSWLLEGVGEPYMVHHTYSDEETADLVNEHLIDEQWNVQLLRHDSWPAVVLTQPATMLVGKNEVAYTAIEIIAGPVGEETFELLQKAKHSLQTSLDDLTMRKIYAGKLGSSFFLSEPYTSLLDREAEPLSKPGLNRVAEPKTGYIIETLMRKAIEYVEDACLEEAINLPAEQKSRAIAAVYRYMHRTHSTVIEKNALIAILDAI